MVHQNNACPGSTPIASRIGCEESEEKIVVEAVSSMPNADNARWFVRDRGVSILGDTENDEGVVLFVCSR